MAAARASGSPRVKWMPSTSSVTCSAIAPTSEQMTGRRNAHASDTTRRKTLFPEGRHNGPVNACHSASQLIYLVGTIVVHDSLRKRALILFGEEIFDFLYERRRGMAEVVAVQLNLEVGEALLPKDCHRSEDDLNTLDVDHLSKEAEAVLWSVKSGKL